ncbi:hypothetical protein ACFIOY_19485 [Bradyrhizobium sp. TZ2]
MNGTATAEPSPEFLSGGEQETSDTGESEQPRAVAAEPLRGGIRRAAVLRCNLHP